MKKSYDQLIAGLDIGSSAVRLVVGQRYARAEQEEGPSELNILAAVEVPSTGMHKGTISSIEDVVSSVSACLERAERMVGVKLNKFLRVVEPKFCGRFFKHGIHVVTPL